MFWATLATTFLLSLSLSVDDFTVGVTYGVRRMVLRPGKLAVMVLGSTISMAGSMLLARWLTAPLSHVVTRYLAAGLLGGLGVWTFLRARREGCKSFEPVVPQTPVAEPHRGEAFYLGLALGIDDFAEAIGLAVAGFPIALTVALFKLSELVAVTAGALLGSAGLARVAGCKLNYLPSLALLAVGFWQLF